ncbi:MAG TPA: glycosyl hydrolase family 8 [Chloroflexia bacterium]|nr:glycosyl hydrolase family 8 [Chloroflexia bacterium]
MSIMKSRLRFFTSRLQQLSGLFIALLIMLTLAACGDNAAAPTSTSQKSPSAATTSASSPASTRANPTAPATVTPSNSNTNPTTAAVTPGTPVTTGSTQAATTSAVAGAEASPNAAGTTNPQSTASSAQASPTATLSSAQIKEEARAKLDELWQTYKERYVQQDGRVRDPQRTDASTSEGESYALLRSVWQNDRPTFDSVLNWSINNLQKPRGDNLFSYLWGKADDNTWKVLDTHAASDADQDIAFALVLASQKWNNPTYLQQARDIMGGIWNKLVAQINGKPYLTAGDWAPGQKIVILNPSYLAPYEYRIFAGLDPDKSHNWSELVNTSYEVIQNCTSNKLDSSGGKLPPNWCGIDKQSGAIVPASQQDKNFDSDFGYDAFRTIWRVALDYRWNDEKRALNYLQSLTPLINDWKNNQKLAVKYNHDGQSLDNGDDLGIYSGAGLALFSVINPTQADQLTANRILPGLKNLGNDDPDPAHINAATARTYYAQNWTWFGLALYTGTLTKPDLQNLK